MNRDPLRVRHCTTYHPKPLTVVENLPGACAELTPDQLRLLAAALLSAADDCEALFEQTRWYGPVRREYSLDPASAAKAVDAFGFRLDAQPIIKRA